MPGVKAKWCHRCVFFSRPPRSTVAPQSHVGGAGRCGLFKTWGMPTVCEWSSKLARGEPLLLAGRSPNPPVSSRILDDFSACEPHTLARAQTSTRNRAVGMARCDCARQFLHQARRAARIPRLPLGATQSGRRDLGKGWPSRVATTVCQARTVWGKILHCDPAWVEASGLLSSMVARPSAWVCPRCQGCKAEHNPCRKCGQLGGPIRRCHQSASHAFRRAQPF